MMIIAVVHYGSEQPDFPASNHLHSHQLESERMSERMSAAERASEASRAEEASASGWANGQASDQELASGCFEP